MSGLKKYNRVLLIFIWLALTCSLGIWWFYLGLENVSRMIELRQQIGGAQLADDLADYERQAYMILTEGLFFMGLLLLGGFGMLVLAYREIQRSHLMQDFFSTVTHEMKTPLASLQLQIEALLEDFEDRPEAERLARVLKENQRIERQMNKAFYLASLMRGEGLFIEEDELEPIIRRLQMDFPDLIVKHTPGLKLKADMRALESIIKNLVENSMQHGKADRIELLADTMPGDVSQVRILLRDNGQGFTGNPDRLGQAFVRQSPTSGTGIGIYIVQSLCRQMDGRVRFANRVDAAGFEVELQLPGVGGGR